MTEQFSSVFRGALKFFSGTMLSRITGLGRDLALAFCFGSHPALAAFMVSYRLAYVVRRLFGEELIQQGFVPHFETYRKEDPKKGAFFFRDLFFSLLVILVCVVLLFEGFLWRGMRESSGEVIPLMMVMLPGLIFICLASLNSALLQCEKRFFLISAAPMAFNFVLIGAIFFLKDETTSQAITALAYCVTAAFFIQWLVTLPKTVQFLKRFFSFKELFSGKLFSPEIRALIKALIFALLGVAAMQLNSAIGGIFALYSSAEGPAYLWYAIRVQQLPLALFGIALSSALLPTLSRATMAGDRERYQEIIQSALKRVFTLIFPCVIGIFVLGASAINLVYGRGNFSLMATQETTLSLWGYGFGLLPAAFIQIFAPAFFAHKDYKTPAKAALYSLLLDCGLNGVMVFGLHWGATSIAIATSISALFNSLFLGRKLGQIYQIRLFVPETIRSMAKVAACALIAGIVSAAMGYFLTSDPSVSILKGLREVAFARSFSLQLLQFFTLAGSFLLMFISYSWVFGVEDVLELMGIRKISKSSS